MKRPACAGLFMVAADQRRWPTALLEVLLLEPWLAAPCVPAGPAPSAVVPSVAPRPPFNPDPGCADWLRAAFSDVPLPLAPRTASPPDAPGCAADPATPDGPRPEELSPCCGALVVAALPPPGLPGAFGLDDAPLSAPRPQAASAAEATKARTSARACIYLVVVLLLGVELEELMPPLEPVEPDELGELELLPLEEPAEPDELGELELLPPAEPPAPIEPVLLPPELPDAPELALPDEPPASEPPPLPQAVRDSAAAAMMASAVPRVNLDAFIWELLGWDCVWRERENGSPRCLNSL
jgi:hypothetical protein